MIKKKSMIQQLLRASAKFNMKFIHTKAK